MEPRIFSALLKARWNENKFVCVGLDIALKQIPDCVRRESVYTTIYRFNCAIVDATCDIVCAYKPNMAFYGQQGEEGWLALRDTITYIHSVAPGVPVIIDGKRLDIGTTNDGYVDELFGLLEADAITIHNYLGMEAAKPFLDCTDKGIFVLCRTSNPGAGEFQDLMMNIEPRQFAELYLGHAPGAVGFSLKNPMPLYQYVAHRVAAGGSGWNRNGNCGVVVGATYPNELAEVRRIVGDMPILIPGIGAQGGDLEKTVHAGMDSKGQGMIINSSRGIIFASRGEDFAEVAHREAEALHDAINQCRKGR
jgi:orotidine-5'-phosphate decarboxylase